MWVFQKFPILDMTGFEKDAPFFLTLEKMSFLGREKVSQWEKEN